MCLLEDLGKVTFVVATAMHLLSPSTPPPPPPRPVQLPGGRLIQCLRADECERERKELCWLQPSLLPLDTYPVGPRCPYSTGLPSSQGGRTRMNPRWQARGCVGSIDRFESWVAALIDNCSTAYGLLHVCMYVHYIQSNLLIHGYIHVCMSQ